MNAPAQPTSQADELTVLLRAWQDGDPRATERLFEIVYPELRKIAGRQLAARRGATYQPTELVHEAYLKLERAGALEWESRLQFFALAAKVVRQVVVDRVRSRAAEKRGGAGDDATLEPERLALPTPSLDPLALDEALHRLADVDAEAARVVELRYFGGLTVPETARVLGVGTATVSRRWQMARAWLRRELTGDAV